MKLGFVILSHLEPDKHYIDLLNFLSQFKNSVIGIHHDTNKSNFPDHLIDNFNIVRPKKVFNTAWAHISKVFALYEVIKELYNSVHSPDWYISLSPNCYPIKSVQFIRRFFENSEYDFYLQCEDVTEKNSPIANWTFQALFTDVLFRFPSISRRTGKWHMKSIRTRKSVDLTPYKNYVPYIGSDWYFLNRRAVNRLLMHNIYENSIVKYISERNIKDPDYNISPVEHVFQTILMNQKDLKPCKDYYRYIDWQGTVDWHPRVLTESDFEDIKHSMGLFARKFKTRESDTLITKINKELLS